ncbi:hypothetical protein PYW08_001888 [Mythimna loreyi]|uniref:Uncharacterized protein n=1 Tax=Mythimna loreyi TaxID=667449 RepID=A0ACC2R161_9NEOP|nr:hypothetical protein PYW08_001888 [Mythimna loreyi]
MLCFAVFFVCLLCVCSIESSGVTFRCNDSMIEPDVSYSTFAPSLDGVRGRYTAELCTFNQPNRTLLTMDLTYNENTNICDAEFRRKYRRWVIKPGPQHSSNTVNVSGLATCSHVCYSMDFDLIFSSCYLLKSTLNGEHRSYSPHDDYYKINNNITKQEYNRTSPYINFVNHDDGFTLDWILGLPAVDYNVTLRKINNDTGAFLDEGVEVTKNCTLLSHTELRCRLAPPYGCYQASFEHGGLWTSGVYHHKKFVSYDHLCHAAVQSPLVEARAGSVAQWWVCGAALLAAAALLGAVLLRRRRLLRDYHKRVLDFWFNNRSSPTESPAAVTRDSRAVLLLYAREGELGQQAMAALRDLVQQTTGGTVYDMFSAEVMALCGAAPATWLRGVLARDDVRVLLVQSPATAALYQDTLCDDEGGLRLREPLLGRRAMYRAPHFGDQLLKMALRHIAETATSHQDYNKYYLATYSGLETDILPGVVSYRRYELPDAARALAHDLARAPPAAAPLAGLARALHAHLQHVQHNPDYLMDEIFIN